MMKLPTGNIGGGRPLPKNPKPIDVLGGGMAGAPSTGVTPILGVMHDGGEVEKDGAYELEKGEKVVPASKKKKEPKAEETEGRNSEYRKVYLSRSKGKK